MSSNPRLGDEVGKGAKASTKVEVGFRKVDGIPSTLLVEKPLTSRWRCRDVPKRPNTRIQYYEVVDVLRGTVLWVGRNKGVGNMIAERMAGWQEAVYFPPKQDEPGPAIVSERSDV